MKLACAVLLAACSSRDPKPSVEAPPVVPARVASQSPIPRATTQLITAIVDDWGSSTVIMQHWERDGAGWMQIGRRWAGVIGKTGAAWGIGLHGVGAPSGREGPVKREGDGKSPAGLFTITHGYGYAAKPPQFTRVPYTAVDDSWQCVDDPRSAQYGRVLDRRTIPSADWTSAEQMRRPDALYTWVLDTAHNPAHTPGGGSCIFLHVWSGPDSTTVGCTAMPEEELRGVIELLDRDAVFVLLPRAEYDALAEPWGLPR